MEDNQFIIFQLGNEEFGINIINVQEIIQPPKITVLPCAPPYVLGITNLRDVIIPVIDLKKWLGLEDGGGTEEARVIVVRIENRSYGVIVDCVREVLRISNTQIERGDEVYRQIESAFISGIARLEDRLVVILELTADI